MSHTRLSLNSPVILLVLNLKIQMRLAYFDTLLGEWVELIKVSLSPLVTHLKQAS